MLYYIMLYQYVYTYIYIYIYTYLHTRNLHTQEGLLRIADGCGRLGSIVEIRIRNVLQALLSTIGCAFQC